MSPVNCASDVGDTQTSQLLSGCASKSSSQLTGQLTTNFSSFSSHTTFQQTYTRDINFSAGGPGGGLAVGAGRHVTHSQPHSADNRGSKMRSSGVVGLAAGGVGVLTTAPLEESSLESPLLEAEDNGTNVASTLAEPPFSELGGFLQFYPGIT